MSKLALIGIAAAVFVVLIVLLVSIFSGSGDESTSDQSTPAPQEATTQQNEPSNPGSPAEGQPPTEGQTPSPMKQGGQAAAVGGTSSDENSAGQLALRQPSALRLTVRGLETTWLRVSVDRAPAVDVQLQTAETMEWDANEEIRLTVGKSNAVAIYLNGEDIVLNEEPNRMVPGIVLNKLTLLRLEN